MTRSLPGAVPIDCYASATDSWSPAFRRQRSEYPPKGGTPTYEQDWAHMRTSDLLTIALSALWQQKLRSLLTLGGIMIGSFALAVSLSLGRGFEAEVMRQLGRRDQLRQIIVWPHSEVNEADI